ncbi:MAG: hypothetical protein WC322_07050, partial [Candidatus Paceibacterota bacterium]
MLFTLKLTEEDLTLLTNLCVAASEDVAESLSLAETYEQAVEASQKAFYGLRLLGLALALDEALKSQPEAAGDLQQQLEEILAGPLRPDDVLYAPLRGSFVLKGEGEGSHEIDYEALLAFKGEGEGSPEGSHEIDYEALLKELLSAEDYAAYAS